ncbi:MAG: acetylglutamate kinase [Verrucomicrobia bacterium]|nr:acetylglutamate kinase [Verrucomicrobiota bacterium]
MSAATTIADSAAAHRVEALIDALPFILEHRGKVFVIKYGGSAMEDEHLIDRTLRDIVFLSAVGIRPVVVHGGGKLITDRMRAAGMKARFVNGLRVTDAASIRLVAEALDGVTNPMIAGKLRMFGGAAEGVSGTSVVRARRLPPQRDVASGEEAVDIGFVGEVSALDLAQVRALLGGGTIPVISPLAREDSAAERVTLNVNADLVAAAVASELPASKLIYLSDVPGLMRDPSDRQSLIPSVTAAQIKRLVKDEVIHGGMIPKVQSAVDALARGVDKIHFLDGRTAHSLLLEIFSTQGTGTEIVA